MPMRKEVPDLLSHSNVTSGRAERMASPSSMKNRCMRGAGPVIQVVGKPLDGCHHLPARIAVLHEEFKVQEGTSQRFGKLGGSERSL